MLFPETFLDQTPATQCPKCGVCGKGELCIDYERQADGRVAEAGFYLECIECGHCDDSHATRTAALDAWPPGSYGDEDGGEDR